jgi:transcriptional regulator with XRE-family HTH domain
MERIPIKTIAQQTGLSPQFICDIKKGRRRPSAANAAKLETVTGINRLAWLYPDEYVNPYITRPREATPDIPA